MELSFWISHPANGEFDPKLVVAHDSSWCASCSARLKVWVESQEQIPYAIENLKTLVLNSQL